MADVDEQLFGTDPLLPDSDFDGCVDFYDVRFAECDGEALFGGLPGASGSCSFGEAVLHLPEGAFSEVVPAGTMVRVEGRPYESLRLGGEGGEGQRECVGDGDDGCFRTLLIDGSFESFAVDGRSHRIEVATLATPATATVNENADAGMQPSWSVEIRFLRVDGGEEIARRVGYFSWTAPFCRCFSSPRGGGSELGGRNEIIPFCSR